LATFDLIVLAAAFDRWRIGGLTSRRSRTRRVRRSQVSGFERPWFPIGPTVTVEASKPRKARGVPGEDGLEFKEPLSPCAH
jgi:hypothetical protein